MSHASKEQGRRGDLCLGVADAIIDALASGHVLRTEDSQQRKCLAVDAVKLPLGEVGANKAWAVANIVLEAIRMQFPELDDLKAGFEVTDGGTRVWFERFNIRELRPREAKEAIRGQIKTHFMEMPDPQTGAEFSHATDLNAYWVGPFSDAQKEGFENIIQVLMTFHGINNMNIEILELPDGMFAYKFDAAELQPLLLKEGIAAVQTRQLH
ncbi:MAG: hypothetical protein ACOYNL_05400 [Rickettsiales bacterium]